MKNFESIYSLAIYITQKNPAIKSLNTLCHNHLYVFLKLKLCIFSKLIEYPAYILYEEDQ